MRSEHHGVRGIWAGAAVAVVLLAGGTALATDGGSAPPAPPAGGEGAAATASAADDTYYQATLDGDTAEPLASTSPELPAALHVADAAAVARYRVAGEQAGQQIWELRIEDFVRRHERVDAIYDMVLVLPLPVAKDGRDGFEALERGVRIEEGSAERAVPLVYGGEKIVLKRNVGIEKALLPRLTGGAADQLPDLAGSGLRWTAWDTIVERQADFGETVQARAVLRYATEPGLAPPDPEDPRLAAYLITWIPSLPASVPPYAVRIDVQAAGSP